MPGGWSTVAMALSEVGHLPGWLREVPPEQRAAAVAKMPERWRDVLHCREQGVPLGAIAERLRLRLEDTSAAYQRALQRLAASIHRPELAPGPPRIIPFTPMDERYRRIHARLGDRPDPSRRLAGQLDQAREALEDPDALARDFERSVAAFTLYDNRGEAFHPTGREREGPIAWHERWPRDRILNTHHVGAFLYAGRVDWDGTPAYEYVDREVWPARTTGRATVASPEASPARAVPHLDLLLAGASDRTPTVAEVKVAGDESPFYALIQVLAQAAQLASPTQRARLAEWYPDRFGTEERIDIVILLAEHTGRGPLHDGLRACADALAARLMERHEVSRWVRRIACLDLALDRERNRLRATSCFSHPEK